MIIILKYIYVDVAWCVSKHYFQCCKQNSESNINALLLDEYDEMHAQQQHICAANA